MHVVSSLVSLLKSSRRMLIHIGAVYFITFLVVLPILLCKLKYSAYYWGYDDLHDEREKEWHLNEERAKVAKNWVKEQKISNRNYLSSSSALSHIEQVDVIITVISTRRDDIDGSDPQYVTQTVAKTFELLRDFQQRSGLSNFFGLVLCNVDQDPRTYAELNFLSRSLHLLQLVRFLVRPPSHLEQQNRYVKEQSDYSYCLRKSLELNPNSYIFLLEDDAVPIPDAFWVLHHTITHSLKHRISEDTKDKIGFIKFYHPYRFIHRARYSELIGLGAIFGTVLTFIYLNLCMLWGGGSQLQKVYLCWALFVLFAFLVFLSFGQANILKFRHVSKHLYITEPAAECCTPAMLFTHKSGRLLADYYDAHQCTASNPKACAMDLLLGSFLQDTGTTGLMVLPNIFDHIGMYSIVKNNVKNPEIVN